MNLEFEYGQGMMNACLPDNTELWELDTQTGEKRLIGQWHNSNAVNAAKEP